MNLKKAHLLAPLCLVLVTACKHTPAQTIPAEVEAAPPNSLTLESDDCTERPVVIFSGSTQDVQKIAQGNIDAEIWQRFILEQETYPAAPICNRTIPAGQDAEASIVFGPRYDFWQTFFRQEHGGQWGTTQPGSSTIELVTIDAPPRKRRCAEQGLIEDDAGPMPLCIDLPRDYDAAKRYPVVWLLPGYSGDDFARLQALQDSTEDAILIGVDSRHEHGTSYFEDTETSGRWLEKLQQAREHVDARYQTTGAHALLGKSTGGFNAVSLLLRDQAWDCAAAFAPDGLDLENWLLEDGKVAPLWLAWSRMEATVGGPGQMTSYAHAWSDGVFPYSLETGEVHESFASWRAHSPLEMLEPAPERIANKLYLASALHDEFDLHPYAVAFHEALVAKNVEHVWRELDTGHFNITKAHYEEGLRYCIDALAASE